MICCVIKNKEGEYLAIGQGYRHYWSSIDFAYYFRELPGLNFKKAVEEYRDNHYPDCKVVKVEIKGTKYDTER